MKNKKVFLFWKIVNIIFWLAYGLACVWIMNHTSMMPLKTTFGVWFVEITMIMGCCVALWRIYVKTTESFDKSKERTKKFLRSRIDFYNKEITRCEKEILDLGE